MISNKQYTDTCVHSASPAMIVPGKTIARGDSVTVDYTGWLDDGRIFDTTSAAIAQHAGIYDADCPYAPFSFIAGTGAVIPGFDEAVIGLKAGEYVDVTLTPDRAYGTYDPALIRPMPIGLFEKNGSMPHINDILYYEGQPVRIDRIVFCGAGVSKSTVYVDFNHPLGGKKLHFMIIVRDIRPMNQP
jgi:peptidylprolyl isomerase